MHDFVVKFIKFGLVGATGVVVDFGITWVLKEWARLNRYVASSIGFFCAVISNYILNRIWTFESHDNAVGLQFAKFFGVALVGLAINNSLIYYFHERRKFSFYVAKALATGIVVLWNFGINYLVTFKA